MSKDSLGDRMKGYENIPRTHLTPRMPIIIRVDGKAFHTYTKGFEKPWDDVLQNAMSTAAVSLIESIQGAEVAYIQSDEISVLINTYKTFATQQYFDGNVQKISSVAASIATAAFNRNIIDSLPEKHSGQCALFDARCFVVPREEAVNYFVWRQQDAIRNSISGFAQANFSHKQLHGKSQEKMKEMLLDKGIDWSMIRIRDQRGWCVVRKTTKKKDVVRSVIEADYEIPVFSNHRYYLDKYLAQVEE